jgi:hypothetical protein
MAERRDSDSDLGFGLDLRFDLGHEFDSLGNQDDGNCENY